MQGRAVAWVAYVPLPGSFLVPLLAAPQDRLARYHARQGGLLVGGAYLLLLVVGLIDVAAPANWLQWIAGIVSGMTLLGIVAGGLGAARGRFTRVRGVWDLLARALT